jgi:hypothetical protein
MQQYLLRSIWLAFRIWLLAVILNAVIGTLILSFSGATIEIFYFGLLMGAVCALPVFLTQVIVIYTGSSTGGIGAVIFRQTIIAGEIATAIIVLLFFGLSGMFDTDGILLSCTALASGAIATAFHIGALHEMDSDFNHIQSINTSQHEN